MEVHLLGFSGDVYGETLEVEFIRHLRNNRRFDSLDALREQLERDRETVAGLPIDGVGEAERC